MGSGKCRIGAGRGQYLRYGMVLTTVFCHERGQMSDESQHQWRDAGDGDNEPHAWPSLRALSGKSVVDGIAGD